MTQTGTTFNHDLSLIPGARVATNLSAKANYIVKVSAAHADGPEFALTAAVTDKPGGILQKGVDGSTSAGAKSAEVAHRGISQVVSGAAVTAGARVQPDGSGRAIPAAATGYSFGYALTSCTAADELITIAFDCAGANLVA
jgi:hypothetical protein